MLTKIRRFISFFIGDLSWKPPGWLRRLCGTCIGWVRTHRRASAVFALLLVATMLGGWRAWDWHQHRPKPVTVSVKVEPPIVPRLMKEMEPPPLSIVFGTSVAPVENQAGQPVTAGIRMEPPVAGEWKWTTDRRLMFWPKNDWPAGRKYRIALDRSLFPKQIGRASCRERVCLAV